MEISDSADLELAYRNKEDILYTDQFIKYSISLIKDWFFLNMTGQSEGCMVNQ